MSTLTHGCIDAYAEGVNNTCDTVDTSIKVSTSCRYCHTTTSIKISTS